MNKILIENPGAYEATRGETLELHFTILTMPVISEVQKKAIQAGIEKDRHLLIKKIDTAPGYLIITVEVIDNPFPLILIIGSITAILSGWFIWSSVAKVYKIVESPEARKTINIGLIVAGGIVAIVLGTMFKKGG